MSEAGAPTASPHVRCSCGGFRTLKARGVVGLSASLAWMFPPK